MDPNEVIQEGFEENPRLWPSSLPTGVKADRGYYAYRRAYADGRVEWQFFKRGSGGGEGGVGDAVLATSTETDAKQKEKFDKDRQEAATRAPTTRVINGVPHERGPDGVYRPVQTEAGAATPGAPSQAQAAAPGGRPYIDDGPEAGQTGRRWGWNPETRLYDRDLGPSPSAQKPAEDAKPRQVTGSDGRIYSVVTRPGPNGAPVTEVYGPDGTLVPGGVVPGAAKPAEAADVVGKPTGATRPATKDGRTYTEKEYVLPDGTREWRADEAGAKPTRGRTEEPVKDQPGWKQVTEVDEATGTKRSYYLNPQGQEAPLPEKSSFATEPSGAPAFSAQYGSIVEQSLTKYRDFLNEQVKAGALKPADADKLMASRLAQVKATMDEQQSVINTQAGLYGQQISQRGQTLSDTAGRRTAAGNIHSTIMQSFMPLLKYMPLGGGQAFLDLLTHGMEEGLKNAARWGGLRESPEIQMGPAAAAANRATLPGQATPPIIGPGSFLSPYQTAPAAPQPDAQAATDAAAAAAAQAQSIRQNPVFRPQPQVALPPAAPPPSGQGSDLSMPANHIQMTFPPGYGPDAPMPAISPAALAGMMERGNQALVPNQGPVSFLNLYRQPQPPAGSGLARLLSDPDIDNALVAQAYADVYGAPLPGFG